MITNAQIQALADERFFRDHFPTITREIVLATARAHRDAASNRVWIDRILRDLKAMIAPKSQLGGYVDTEAIGVYHPPG